LKGGTMEHKLAVLIDAENIAPKYIETILREANSIGNVIYKRIYGNWTTQEMSSWKSVVLDYAILPIQQFSFASGKNASDSALIIDAMDLLFSQGLSGFCIISSDSDYTRLASRLRESDMYVVGMGEQKTPKSFVSACNTFKYLDILFNAAADDAGTAKPEPSEPKTALDLEAIKKALRQLVTENSDEEGWIFSGRLGALLAKQFPAFDARNFGYRKFTSFIDSLALFEKKQGASPGTIYFMLKQ